MSEDEARKQEQEAEQDREQQEQNGSGDGGGILSRLLRKEVLIPVGASAASAGIAWLVRNGGDLVDQVRDSGHDMGERAASKVADEGTEQAKKKMEGSGGLSGIAGKLMPGGNGGGDGDDGEVEEGRADPNTRRLPIQRWTDVAAPVETCWEAWTDFEEYPEFMHRVLTVELEEEDDEKVVKWSEKIWFWTREWEAEVTELVPNERIAWKTKSGPKHHGIVTFHRLDDKLTRVLVTVDFHPTGMFEKMASGMRFVKRAVQSDLARFKAYVELELQKESEEGSKGRSEDGEGRQQGSRQERSGREQRGKSGNGNGGSPQGKQEDDDGEDAEAEREERAARREQRRERTSA